MPCGASVSPLGVVRSHTPAWRWVPIKDPINSPAVSLERQVGGGRLIYAPGAPQARCQWKQPDTAVWQAGWHWRWVPECVRRCSWSACAARSVAVKRWSDDKLIIFNAAVRDSQASHYPVNHPHSPLRPITGARGDGDIRRRPAWWMGACIYGTWASCQTH